MPGYTILSQKNPFVPWYVVLPVNILTLTFIVMSSDALLHLATNIPHLATNNPHLATNIPHLATNIPHLETNIPTLQRTFPTLQRMRDVFVIVRLARPLFTVRINNVRYRWAAETNLRDALFTDTAIYVPTQTEIQKMYPPLKRGGVQ